MSYFEDERTRRGPGWFGILFLLLMAAVLGGSTTLVGAHYLGYLNPSNEGIIIQEGDNQRTRLLSLEDEISVVSAVAEAVSPSVVQISNFGSSGFWQGGQEMQFGTGSGVIIDKEGHIVTNNHVVANASRLEVTLYDGEKYPAELVGSDIRTDLAVIKIEAENLSVASFGDSEKVVVGELAIAIGNPGGSDFANSVTVGFVSGLNRLVQNGEGMQFRLIQTDAAINPGNSGGPLVNRKGEIIGINSIKIAANAYEGMGFSIPSNTVESIVSDLIAHRKVLRPALGVGLLYDVTPAFAELNHLGVDYGVVVMPQPGGAAEAAGMARYDIVIAVDGKKIENGFNLQEEIFSRKIGDTIQVTVYRDGQELNLEVVLAELS